VQELLLILMYFLNPLQVTWPGNNPANKKATMQWPSYL
jgi:hypothetical protein